MAIKIQQGDITLYRPAKSIKRQFLTDNYGEHIGVKDEISITDTVLWNDLDTGQNLPKHLNKIVQLFNKWINITDDDGISFAGGKVISVDIDNSSDHYNILKYTINIEDYAPNVEIENKWGIKTSDGVRELSSDESIEAPDDYQYILLPRLHQQPFGKIPNDPKELELLKQSVAEKQFVSKTLTYSCNIQVTCGHISKDHDIRQAAEKVIKKLKRIAPSELIQKTLPQYAGLAAIQTKLQESYGEDGSATLQIQAMLIPPSKTDEEGNRINVPMVFDAIVVNEDISKEYVKSPMEYEKIAYKVTFRGLRPLKINQDTEDKENNKTGLEEEAQNIYLPAETHALWLRDYYYEENKEIFLIEENNLSYSSAKTIPILDHTPMHQLEPPGGKILECREPPTQEHTFPDLPNYTCYTVTSVGVEVSPSDGTAIVTIEATTEPVNCDLNGYKTTWNVAEVNKSTYAELFGWGVDQSIVQDLKSSPATTKDITVNVTSESKCIVQPLKAAAIAQYDMLLKDIKDEYDTVTTIKHNLTVTAGRSSISATVHLMGKKPPSST